jgi:UDP-N-acetylglucosamine 4,6-dehydratase/5-epimerase
MAPAQTEIMEETKMLNGKTVLITGGTGSFGRAFIKRVLAHYKPEKLIVFSRDELKQFEMQQVFKDDCLRYFIGDIRDRCRLHRAFEGVDIIVHAAAMKHVTASEYNPFEAVNTNILGSENIINEAIDNNIEKVIALSTDKAVDPANLYGATKLCAEKLFVAGNNYVGKLHRTKMSVVRYGNVIGSRGSVIPFFMKEKKKGVIPITDKRMTRFWITIDEAVDFVLSSLEMMEGGEIFVPKLPAMNIMDLAKAMAPDCEHKIVGIRPGEKLHETMLTETEARSSAELPTRYIVRPEHVESFSKKYDNEKAVPDSFKYASNTTTEILEIEKLRGLIDNWYEQESYYSVRP